MLILVKLILNFRTAFDFVNHEILLAKLNTYKVYEE